jgi:hypothetical protein
MEKTIAWDNKMIKPLKFVLILTYYVKIQFKLSRDDGPNTSMLQADL